MTKRPLMLSDRFWPIYWTQFWGAMNDNILKNAIVILITFKSYSLLGLNESQMVALCGGIFILPFFLFSSLAGQYSDKLSKSKLVILTKIIEVGVIILGAFGFFYESITLLMTSLFLAGVQSTIFGPAKYSILPELLTEDELVQGNALVEMGTFLSILFGMIIGTMLPAKENSAMLISITILAVSIFGLICSLKVPKLAPVEPTLKIDPNLFRSTLEIIKISKQVKSIYISILGISWFWFFGAALLSIFPVYVKDILHANGDVVTLVLAIFSIGVAIGSIFCERVSHGKVELGLVPVGSIGISLFVLSLYLIGKPYEASGELLGFSEFLNQPNTFPIIISLFGLSIMSGFFIVPLYTFLQVRSDRETRSRIIAANNIMNAIFMVAAAISLMVLFALGLTTVEVFLFLFILNTLASIYIYRVIPEFMWRFVCFIVSILFYRVTFKGRENIPSSGGAIVTCNHVSFIDWIFLAGAIHRPARFVMHYSFMKIPVMSHFFKASKVIPIAGMKEDPKLMEEAFVKMRQTLEEGEILFIFPEGQSTENGELSVFRPGLERLLKEVPVPVIPMTLKGLWGSFTSRKYGKACSKYSVIFTKPRPKVEVEAFPAKDPGTKASELEVFYRTKIDYSKD